MCRVISELGTDKMRRKYDKRFTGNRACKVHRCTRFIFRLFHLISSDDLWVKFANIVSDWF